MRLALLLVVVAACGGGPSIGDDDDDVPPGAGTFSFKWRIESDGALATCAQFGATQIEIISNGPSGETVDRFSCVPMGSGTTSPVSPGSYSNLVSLLDAGASSVQTLPAETNVVQEGSNVDIGTFFFTFGSACDASTCGGCCNGNSCVNAQSDTQCGIGGIPCDNCAAFGLFCDTTNGFCIQ